MLIDIIHNVNTHRELVIIRTTAATTRTRIVDIDIHSTITDISASPKIRMQHIVLISLYEIILYIKVMHTRATFNNMVIHMDIFVNITCCMIVLR